MGLIRSRCSGSLSCGAEVAAGGRDCADKRREGLRSEAFKAAACAASAGR